MTKFASGAATDVGQVRQVNQDSILDSNEDGLFAVADGMGGHRGGEVASEVAIDALKSNFTDKTTETLVMAVRNANRAIVARAKDDPDLRGMGTTMCALASVVLDDGEECLAIVNVGDSRAYLLKAEEGELCQLSEDHSLVATLVRQGQLTPDEAAVHPQRNILTRALGIDQEVLPDSFTLLPVKGDRYLLCSDGLFNEVEEPVIAQVLQALADPTEAAEELVRLANEGGGRDNISVVIVDVTDDAGHHDFLEQQSDEHRVIEVVHGPERMTGSAASASTDGTAATGAGTATATMAGTATAVTADASPAGVTVQPGVGPPPLADPQFAASPPKTKMTWRVGLFAVALVGIFALTFAAIQWYATSTYYVGADNDEVVIFRGRPGGVLWYQPSVEQRTGIRLAIVPPPYNEDVRAGRDQASVEEALAYIANIQKQIASQAASVPSSTPTPTTSTTKPGLGGAITGGPSVTSTVPAPTSVAP